MFPVAGRGRWLDAIRWRARQSWRIFIVPDKDANVVNLLLADVDGISGEASLLPRYRQIGRNALTLGRCRIPSLYCIIVRDVGHFNLVLRFVDARRSDKMPINHIPMHLHVPAHTHTHTEREREREPPTHTHSHIHTERKRERQTHTYRQTHIQREREREREREIMYFILIWSL